MVKKSMVGKEGRDKEKETAKSPQLNTRELTGSHDHQVI